MSVSVTLKSYFYEVLIPSSQKNTSSPIEDILHHVSKYIFYEKACALQMFQSTHPHGVRPSWKSTSRTTTGSFNPRTHMGCDYPGYPGHHKNPQFQSTHPHGVRQRIRIFRIFPLSFNPRTHTGCDSANSTDHPTTLVSIHAPTRGATGRWVASLTFSLFQSTHPHGVRHIRLIRSSE